MISIHALLAESDDITDTVEKMIGISIHALLAESDTIFAVRPYDAPIFLSTLSLRRATLMWYQCNTVVKISIHALLAESDLPKFLPGLGCQISIHALLAESDASRGITPKGCKYFYPRSPCGERRLRAYQRYFAADISIHALLAESDLLDWDAIGYTPKISIHALLAESDHRRALARRLFYKFLSTLSLRRATIFAVRPYDAPIFLSTLSLRRATKPPLIVSANPPYFYPRSPCGERLGAITYVVMTPDFYPRSPCGERPASAQTRLVSISFLSTLSLRRATEVFASKPRRVLFLSTLSLRRATVRRSQWPILTKYFYPRSPCGERQHPFCAPP